MTLDIDLMRKLFHQGRSQTPETRPETVESDPSRRLVIDFAVRVGSWFYVVGWSGSRVSDIGAIIGDQPCETTIARHDRPDVSDVHGGMPPADLGFVILIPGTGVSGVPSVRWKTSPGGRAQTEAVTPVDEMSDHYLRTLEPVLRQQIETLERGGRDWAAHVVSVPFATGSEDSLPGFVDMIFQKKGLGCVLGGWAACGEDVPLYLMDGDKTLHPLKDQYRFERPDLGETLNVAPHHLARAGFLAFLDQVVTGPLHLLALTEDTATVLTKVPDPKQLPEDPKKAAKKLFDINTPAQSFSQRVAQVDWKILDPLIADQQAEWEKCVVTGGEIGPQPASPDVTLIIPLYGRHDLVEHQLMEFSRDPYIRERVDVLYVIDDPRLVISFQAELSELYQLYGQPYRWVWGSVNRGFSGANNLGTSHARAQRLLFMNSDVFPQGPGWLEQLVEALDTHPTLGIVTPRLLFANGGIQHAGMESRRLESVGIWINHHPNLGLDPEFDPRKTLEAVPLATGACMLTRRDELERLGGWDTGYLIGDFEDSDLCFKYRSAGLDVGYLPTVSLVHLERQSFNQIGKDSFKQRVTMANSVRHSLRWPQFLRD